MSRDDDDKPPPRPPTLSPSALRDIYNSEVADVAATYSSHKKRGAITGLRHLDAALGGFLQPGIYVLHAEPGAGKSAFAWQVAADCECASLFVTTEMSPLELIRRHIARRAKKPRRSLLNANYPVGEEQGMAEFAARSDCPFVLDACSEVATPKVLAEELQLVRKLTGAEHMLCVIDSLHSWSAPLAAQAGITEYEALNEAMAALRKLAEKHKAVLFVVAERNRVSMRTGGLSAVAGTRRVEYGADVVMELNLDPKDDGSSGLQHVDLRIPKNRFGPNGSVIRLSFHGDTMDFKEITYGI